MRQGEHTFVFVDIVGFTAITAERGDEAAADVAQALFARVRGLLADHRAHEVKTLGDALMIRGEDPALAIDLGLAVAASADLPVRVGMHTGSAVERFGDWYGTAVNIAARLCQAAAPGEALISEATTRAAGAAPRGPVEGPRSYALKNVTEPLGAWAARVLPRLELPVAAPRGTA